MELHCFFFLFVTYHSFNFFTGDRHLAWPVCAGSWTNLKVLRISDSVCLLMYLVLYLNKRILPLESEAIELSLPSLLFLIMLS